MEQRKRAEGTVAKETAVTSVESPNRKVKFATAWLDGCSGCHMSLLDLDERLIDLAGRIEIVHGPLVDNKEFPHDVDVTLVEGAIGNEEDLERIRTIRERTKVLVSLGDCAVTANVPGMRNPFGPDAVLRRVYCDDAAGAGFPSEVVPKLLDRVTPIHEVVSVDVYVPGCPPSADVIHYVLCELLEGRQPDLSSQSRFGK